MGLSQVRNSPAFEDLPLTERLHEQDRTCGICVVEIDSGRVAAWLRFESGMQEIFDLRVPAGLRCPELVDDDSSLLENTFSLPGTTGGRAPTQLKVESGTQLICNLVQDLSKDQKGLLSIAGPIPSLENWRIPGFTPIFLLDTGSSNCDY